MATLSNSESRRKYSWWWDSHNTPKNSKWLQENITDMDGKVKTMIKLIEEDADSFARRAEMYYKKRPELMKLVEEFYRAYRALAERYNHATGELRHAHQTIAAAFPDQVPFELDDDSPSKKLEIDVDSDAVLDTDDLVRNPQGLSTSDLHAISKSGPYKEDSEWGLRKRGLKQLQEMFGGNETVSQSSKYGDGKVRRGLKNEKDQEEISREEVLQLSTENQNLKEKVLDETERAGKAERELQGLWKALADMEAEKKDALLQYEQCLEKLSKIEGELITAQMDSMRLDEKAITAEIEVQTLKDALVQLEVEKIAGMIRHEECSEKISHLESMVSQFQEDKKAIGEKAIEAESQAQNLKDEVSRLELEKEAIIHQYQQCLGKILELESIISTSENEARMLKEQSERTESELSGLKLAVSNLNKEKEASALQYKYCLEKISKLEKDIASANDDAKRLSNDLLIGTAKLKATEDKCSLLAMSNQALRVEADDLAKKIAVKDQELLNKQEELESFQSCLREENSRHAQVEAALEVLQNLHSQSQDDQRALTVELKDMLQMLKDVEESKHGLVVEIQQVRDENHSLSQTALSSAASMENMQHEILSLREIRERLKKEVSYHMGISVSLQQEISCLKKEIESLNRSYQALVEQVEAAGLNPKCVGTSIKSLQDENSRLNQICEQGINEKVILLKKLESIEEVLKKKAANENSLSELNGELEMSRAKLKALQESCQFLHGEKATLASEKASLLSQLQAMTENMNCLVRQNAVLENSLSTAKVELEGLREKSKGLEQICDLLKDEKSYLMSERDALVLKLENVERRLETLEKNFVGLEEKYADLEKENEAMLCQVEKLKASLCEEKQERIGSELLSETRMAGLESHIHLLQEENRWKKEESEEELDKAVKAQFEISILQKFITEMEEKNYSLIIECQRHVGASKLAEKVISDLENESLEQQVEAELLLDEIERLRLGIFQIFRALETDQYCAPKEKIEDEQTLVHHVLGIFDNMKRSISNHEHENQQLSVENSVLLALLEQLEFKGSEIELQNIQLEHESEIMAEKLAKANNEKEKLVEINRQLKSDVDEGRQAASILQAELGSLCMKQDDLQKAYNATQEAFCEVNRKNMYLLKKLSDITEEKRQVDRHNIDVVMEYLATANQSAILKSFTAEKIVEVKSLLEDLNRQHVINSILEKEMDELGRKLDLQKAEDLVLKDTVCRLEREMQEMRECNVQMKQDVVTGKESLMQTEEKLLDTETKLEVAEKLNSTLCRTVAELKNDVQKSLEIQDLEKNVSCMSQTNSKQEKEIESLHRVYKDLESELRLLSQEIEENIAREQTLSMELEGMNSEFELWEAEAAMFCFDLQVSSINEVLLKNKVEELTGVCQTLEQKHAAKTSEIEQMEGNICSMENEIDWLKAQLSAYAPVVASLRDDITLIEHHVLLRRRCKAAAHSQEIEFFEMDANPDGNNTQKLEDQSFLSLQNLQTRVKAVRKLMQETNKPILRRRSISKTKQDLVVGEIDQLKVRPSSVRDRPELNRKKGYANELNDSPTDSPNSQKIKMRDSELQNGMLMKDIPLDQVSDSFMRKKCNVGSDDLMLELWETAEDGNGDRTIDQSLRVSYKLKEKSELPSTDSDMEKELGVDKLELSIRTTRCNQEVNDQKILERLASDAEKLQSLQTMVESLRWKLESNTKSQKDKNVDLKTVKQQLQEAEDTIVHLVDLNGQLVKNIEECPPGETLTPRMKHTVKTWKIKVMEQAEKESERIVGLQLSVQKIHYMLSKVEDESKNKGRNKFLRSRTIILRDFIDNGRKNSGRRKKGLRCGCFRQSTGGAGRSL